MKPTREDIMELAQSFINDVNDDWELESITLTCGTNFAMDNWGWQSGDNSFTGGAYPYEFWAVQEVYADSDPEEIAAAVFADWDEQIATTKEFLTNHRVY